jgi:hypothetical protein
MVGKKEPYRYEGSTRYLYTQYVTLLRNPKKRQSLFGVKSVGRYFVPVQRLIN